MLLQNIWFTGIKLLSDTIEDTITLIRYLLLSLCVCLYSYVGGQTPLPLLEEFKPINVFSTVPGHSSIRLTTDLLERIIGNDNKGLVIEYYINETSRKVMKF